MSQKTVSEGIRLITWATAIRWAGWGFVDALIPIFLLSFTNSYAELGILGSIDDLIFVLTTPFIGLLADKISSVTLILIGLAMYPLISASYFLAGFTGLAIFLIIGRVLNGINYSFDCVGRGTYLRRHAHHGAIARTFGYFETVSNTIWLLAVFASIFLVKYFNIHTLFLLIIPTSIIAFIIVKKIKSDKKESFKDGMKEIIHEGVLKTLFHEIYHWSRPLRNAALLTLLLGSIQAIAGIFIPVYIFLDQQNITQAILITAALALPNIFALPIAKYVDGNAKKMITASCLGTATLFIILSTTENYVGQFIIALLLGTTLLITRLGINDITTTLTKKKEYGSISGALEGLETLGEVIGPIIFGIALDYIQGSTLFFATAIAIIILTILIRPRLDQPITISN